MSLACAAAPRSLALVPFRREPHFLFESDDDLARFNPYALLGMSERFRKPVDEVLRNKEDRAAMREEVNRAYKELVRRFHPDMWTRSNWCVRARDDSDAPFSPVGRSLRLV